MKKMFFAWEKSSLGWTPVVYHGEKPVKSVNGTNPERYPTGMIEITPEFIGSDGEPMFGKLQKAYPISE